MGKSYIANETCEFAVINRKDFIRIYKQFDPEQIYKTQILDKIITPFESIVDP